LRLAASSVLLPDSPANPGASDRGQVNTVLGGEPDQGVT
jgi:hypothetical protein